MCMPGAAYNSIAFASPRGASLLPAPADHAQRVLRQAQNRIRPGAGPYATQLGSAVKAAADRRSAKQLLGQ